jgi:hypothetical protein
MRPRPVITGGGGGGGGNELRTSFTATIFGRIGKTPEVRRCSLVLHVVQALERRQANLPTCIDKKKCMTRDLAYSRVFGRLVPVAND